MWFRDLHHRHGDEEERDIPILVAKNAEALRQVDLEDGEDREAVNSEIKRRQLELMTQFEADAEADESELFPVVDE